MAGKREKILKKHKRKKRLKITFKVIFMALGFLFLASICTVALASLGIYNKYSNEFNKIKPQSNSTQLVMYDREGAEIYRGFGASEPIRIPLEEIPEVVKQSTLAAEDLDFYNHGPIDYKSIGRAVYMNWQESDKAGIDRAKELLKENSYTQGGGSTITQQLVKNIYLSPEKSWERKIKEVIFAYNLEKNYSKDEILEMYLNEIYYGEQALGIGNAAKIYFNKDVNDLNLSEASLLAGLPQAPSYYNPLGDNYLQSKKRQEYVLQKMLKAGYINLEEAKSAANVPLDFYGKAESLNKYPFFVEYVKQELAKKIGKENVDSSGYRVYTTLDPKKQAIAEKKVKEGLVKLKSRGASNASVVIQDPKTGEILAMVGGADWNVSKVNVATAERQPGSSFKPIVYATALEGEYTAATILKDTRVNFGGIPPYIPRNYNGGYSGYITMRNALARSLNVPAVEMGKLVGTQNVIDQAHELGITTINDGPSRYGLSLSLGTAEVKLVDLVGAYSVFANKGNRLSQSVITKIIDDKGDELIKEPSGKKQVISEETAYILSSILSDNKARSVVFGSNSPLKTDKITAVKTGTTDNYADSWTVGYSPNLVVGVWMGNNDRTPMRRVSGVEGAAYIWHDTITEALAGYPNTPFTRPGGIKEAWISPRTGALAKYNGSPNILEYFKTGTVPGEKVDLSYLRQF